MWTSRADRGPAGPLVGALLTLLLVVASACSSGAGRPGGEPSPDEPSAQGGLRPVTARDVIAGIDRLLDRRTAAVLAGDRQRFLRGVAPAARDEQATYFDNLRRLPLATYAVAVDRRTLVRDGGGYRGEVEVTVQLAGYDEAPVVSRDRYRFATGPRDRPRVVSTTDEAWEETHGVVSQPWETGPLTVVQGVRTLGLFDAGSADRARRLVSDLENAVSAVAAEVPLEWDGRVVVYALSDPAFLSGLSELPGEDPLALDAVTFPVPADPDATDDPTYAGTRVVLNPRIVATPGPARSRLLRHELTHVALGERQDGVPTWFAEGLAEYVSVQPLAPEDRAISGAALAAAERGLDALPDDDTFNGPTSQANYGVSWWACEYLARTFGESTLWVLLDALRGEDQERVLSEVVDLDERTLARKAGRLMLATYRPPDRPRATASAEPSADASAEPSEDPSAEPSDDRSAENGG